MDRSSLSLRPCSLAMARTNGLNHMRSPWSTDAAGTSSCVGAGSLAAGVVLAAGVAGASALTSPASICLASSASSSMMPMVANTATSPPSGIKIFTKVPLAGAPSSVFTLSVMISTTGSSSLTKSPTCLSQRLTVPSWTDSPSSGMRISVAITYHCSPMPWQSQGCPSSFLGAVPSLRCASRQSVAQAAPVPSATRWQSR